VDLEARIRCRLKALGILNRDYQVISKNKFFTIIKSMGRQYALSNSIFKILLQGGDKNGTSKPPKSL
jgi:hypothetical protein